MDEVMSIPRTEESPAEAPSKGQTLSRIAKVLIFLGIFCVMIYYLCDIFEYPNNYISKRYSLYKELEPGTVDALMIGTSGVDRSWIAAKGFEKYGITVYPFSTDALQCWLALDMIKEALKYQTPKLVILDMRMFVLYDPSEDLKMSKARARRTIDTLDFFSPNRFDAILRTQKVINEADPEESLYEMSYLFTFMQYHSKWSDEDFDPIEQIGTTPSPYLGFYVTRNSARAKKLKKTEWNNKRKPLTEIAEKSLYEILDYCEENNIELLFFDSPHYLADSQVRRTNTLCDILDERGINYVCYTGKMFYNKDGTFDKYISDDADGYFVTDENGNEFPAEYVVHFNGLDVPFLTEEEAVDYMTKHTFDRQTHFYDASHLNFDGAVIFTRLFGDYLVNNYDFESHLEDPKYSQWVGVYSKIKKKVKKYKKAIEAAEAGTLTDEERKEMEKEEKELKDEE